MKLNDTLLPSQEKVQSEGEDDEEENLTEKDNQETLHDKEALKRQYNVEEVKTEATQKSTFPTIQLAQGIKKITSLQPDVIKSSSQSNLTNVANGNNLIQAGNFNLINFPNLPNFNSNSILQQLTNLPKGVIPAAALGSVYNIQSNEQLHNNNMFLSQFHQSTNTKLLNDLIQIQQQQQFEIIIKELIHQQQLQLMQHQNYQQISNNNTVNSSGNFNPCYLLLNHQNQFQQPQNFRQNQQFMPIIFNSNTSFNDSDHEKFEMVLPPTVAPSPSPKFTDSDQLACMCIDYGSNNSANNSINKDVLEEISQKTQVFNVKKPKVIIGRKVNNNITENNNSNASSVADICIENSTLVSRQHFSLELKSSLNIVTKNTSQESSSALIYWQLYCMSKNGLFVNTRYIETGKLIKLLLNKKYTFRFPNTNIRIHFESPPYEKLILTTFFNKNNNHQNQINQAEKNSSSNSLSSVSSLSSISSSSNNSSTSSSPNPIHQVNASAVIQQTASSSFSSNQANSASSVPVSHQPTSSATHSSNKIAQILMQKQMEMLQQQQHNTLKPYDSNKPIKSNQSLNQINDDDSSSSGRYLVFILLIFHF